VTVAVQSTTAASLVRPLAAERTFRPDVEGLRAVAVAMVVLYHAGLPVLTGGFVGVDVFFVLSGYLITGILLRERLTTGRTSFRQFYARRVRRILPAGTLVLVATVLASYQLLGFIRGDLVAVDAQWTSFFAGNLRFGLENTQYENILSRPSPLQHYWSLGVEEQFYLFWPVLFSLLAAVGPARQLTSRLATALAAIIVISFLWSVLQTQEDGVWAFFSPLTRAWELGVGALLAVAGSALLRLPTAAAPWLGWAGIGGIIVSAIGFSNDTPFPGSAAALPVLSTAAVVVAGSLAPGTGVERILRLAPFQWLGRISYGTYLWHWPVLTIATQRYGGLLPWPMTAALVGATLLLAQLTFVALENPVRRSRHLRTRSVATLAVGVLLVSAGFIVASARLVAP
jgi:peptidoglycan/LPS O-acetylase OafA/YrhL